MRPFILTSSLLLPTTFMTQTGTGPILKTIQAGAHAFDIATSEPDKEILREHDSSSDLQRLHTHSYRAHPHGLAELLVILCDLQGICTSRHAYWQNAGRMMHSAAELRDRADTAFYEMLFKPERKREVP